MTSLCMIAGDENEGLTACLDRAAPYVDEIVLVDTGSSGTVQEIAKRYRARYAYRPMSDFASVRQAAVEMASAEWILVLDPDEWISDGDLRAMLAHARNDTLAFRVPRYDYIGGFGWALSRPCRLFRRLPGVRYVGVIYEEPVFSNGCGAEPETAWDVAIHHYGFVQPERRLSRKHAMYRSMVDEAWEGPGDVWNWSTRATLLADVGDWNQAAACCAEALRHVPDFGKPPLLMRMARLCLALGKSERALAALRRAEELMTDSYQHSRLQNLLGLIYLGLARWEEAGAAFAAALNRGFPAAAYWINLAVARQRSGAVASASEAFAQARALNPRAGVPVATPTRYQDEWIHRLDTARHWTQVLNISD